MSWELPFNHIDNTISNLGEVFDTIDFISAWQNLYPDYANEFEKLRGRNWRAIIGRTLKQYSINTNKFYQCSPSSVSPAKWRKKVNNQRNNNSQGKIDEPPVVKNDMSIYYKTLNCNESDTIDMITEKYKLLAKKYHPDVVHSLGLDDDQINLFKIKFQEIQNAFEKIKKHKGIS